MEAGIREREDEAWRTRLQGVPLTPREEARFAEFALGRVSRTFALNIRVLPEPLRGQVLHAYIYCRMADTIEDDAALAPPRKGALLRIFGALFDPELPPEILSRSAAVLPPLLPSAWRADSAWEKVLLARTPAMLAAFAAMPADSRAAIAACVREMSGGMADFAMRQPRAPAGGGLVRTLEDLDRYCWFVAGTVGVMLCELFIRHAGIPGARARRMRELCVSFGNGLQLVNILKDRVEDRDRGVSWLPEGVPITTLVTKTLRHLEEAVEYTLSIPRRRRRLRLFCLWPLLMAAETLARVAGESDGGGRRKISRARVGRIVARTGLLWWSDAWVRAEFDASARRVRAALNAGGRADTFHGP